MTGPSHHLPSSDRLAEMRFSTMKFRFSAWRGFQYEYTPQGLNPPGEKWSFCYRGECKRSRYQPIADLLVSHDPPPLSLSDSLSDRPDAWSAMSPPRRRRYSQALVSNRSLQCFIIPLRYGGHVNFNLASMSPLFSGFQSFVSVLTVIVLRAAPTSALYQRSDRVPK